MILLLCITDIQPSPFKSFLLIKQLFMHKIIYSLFILLSLNSSAQLPVDKPRILYGTISKDSLYNAPFDKWFVPGYNEYIPNSTIVTQLENQDYKDISIEVFFGTWCGDSKREVPRFQKLMHELKFPDKKIKLIAVGGSDSLYKQSPAHEETGKGIFRVPTFIIYKKGIEINRINEFPVLSLERDLLSILGGQPYSPNYHSFATIRKCINDSTLKEDNISVTGLAEQLRASVRNENELNSLGYLFLRQGKKTEALKIFQVNYSLYPESANIASSLGEGYYENEDYKKAVAYLERSLELNKDPQFVKEILKILYKAKEREKV